MARLLTISTLALVATSGFAQHPKIASGLEALDQNSMVDVIVQYAHPPTARHHQRILAQGGVLTGQLDLIKAGRYTLPARVLRGLAQDPDVVHISPNHLLQAAVDDAEAAVNANIALSYGWNGTGIGIAVIDSGIANHPDLKNASGALRVVYSHDFVGGGTDDH